MEYLALILSIVSLALYRELRKELVGKSVIVEKPIPRGSAILIKAKKPDRVRMDKRLKSNKDDISIEELC